MLLGSLLCLAGAGHGSQSMSFLQARAGPMQDLEFGAIRMQYINFAGRTAETVLNEPGFQSVVKLKNHTEMGHFITRLVDSMDLTIVKHGREGFKRFVSLHGGQKSTMDSEANKTSLEALKQEIRQVAKMPNAWVSQTGNSVPLNEEGFSSVVRLGRWFEMDRFIRRTAAEVLDRKVADDKKFHAFIPFYTGKKGRKGFQELIDNLKSVVGSGKSWLSPVHEPLRHAGESCGFDCKGTGYCDWCGRGNACCEESDSKTPRECKAVFNDFLTSSSECMEVASGTNAPLTHAGLGALVKLQNNTETERFVLRVVDDLGYKVTSQMSVMGLVPFYSGVKATKSFGALLQELDLAANPRNGNQAWLSPKPGLATHKSDILRSLQDVDSEHDKVLMFFGGGAKAQKKGGKVLASTIGTNLASVDAEEEEMAVALGEKPGPMRTPAHEEDAEEKVAPAGPRLPTVADFFSQAQSQPEDSSAKVDTTSEIVKQKPQKAQAIKRDGKPKTTVADVFAKMR